MKSEVNILVVDDDEIVRESLLEWLREDGYHVEAAEDGFKALEKFKDRSWNIALVDLKMPKMDGLELMEKIKEIRPETQVIIITAYATVNTAVQAIKVGAYDYLVKPFNLAELEARSRALVRRAQLATSARITHGALTLDTAARRAFVKEEALELSAREVALLEALLLSAGRVVSKDQLADRLYGINDGVGPNAIEVFVHRLRRKIEPAGVLIRTVRGLGYLVEKPAHA